MNSRDKQHIRRYLSVMLSTPDSHCPCFNLLVIFPIWQRARFVPVHLPASLSLRLPVQSVSSALHSRFIHFGGSEERKIKKERKEGREKRIAGRHYREEEREKRWKRGEKPAERGGLEASYICDSAWLFDCSCVCVSVGMYASPYHCTSLPLQDVKRWLSD